MEIVIRITNNYGREAIYPANEAARVFALIAGTKTLSRATLKYIKDLGYTIKVQSPEL